MTVSPSGYSSEDNMVADSIDENMQESVIAAIVFDTAFDNNTISQLPDVIKYTIRMPSFEVSNDCHGLSQCEGAGRCMGMV